MYSHFSPLYRRRQISIRTVQSMAIGIQIPARPTPKTLIATTASVSRTTHMPMMDI